MNNPLNRKMFREAGMSKQPMGILASSPELMNAAKGYNKGGLRIGYPYENIAEEFSTKGVPSAIPNIPMYNTPKFNIFRNRGDTVGLGEIGSSQIGDKLSEIKEKNELKNKNVEPNVVVPASINDQTKKIIEDTTLGDEANKFNVKKLRPSFSGKEDDDTTDNTDNTDNKLKPKTSTTTSDLYGFDMETKVKEERDKIAEAMTKYNNDVAESADMEFLGTSLNKELEKQMALLREEDQPFTIAEATKKFKELGYKDNEELTEDYNEDKQASFWLNLMKAGLATAAGTSSNAITNMARGFTVGLQGYGEDTGKLSKELRADKKEASRIMFDLVKDGKSERLATKALNLQKSAAITNILTTKVGEERDRLLAEVNNQTANRKLTISLYKSFADMNLEAKKWDLQSEQYSESVKMAYAKMMPEDLKLLQAAGQITVIDPNQPLTPENIKATPDGTKNIQLLIENLKTGKSGKVTDGRYEQGTAAAKGKTATGIVLNWPGKKDYNAREAGDDITKYNKARLDRVKNAGSENVMIAGEDIQFAGVAGGKIDFSLQTDRMKEIFKKKPADGTQSLFEKHIDLFININ